MTQSKKTITCILQHGWGFDSSLWDSWKVHLPIEINLKRLDRGYFTDADNNPFLGEELYTNECTIAVVHSLGLHLLPKSFFQYLDGLVIIAGFISFNDMSTPDNPFIQSMLQKIPESSAEILSRFHQRCGCTSAWVGKNLKINQTLLIQDLKQLDQQSFDIQHLKKIPKIILMHGVKDKIVPLEKSIELQCLLPQSKLFVRNDAGHALPSTHSEWCCQTINEEMINFMIGDANA